MISHGVLFMRRAEEAHPGLKYCFCRRSNAIPTALKQDSLIGCKRLLRGAAPRNTKTSFLSLSNVESRPSRRFLLRLCAKSHLIMRFFLTLARKSDILKYHIYSRENL